MRHDGVKIMDRSSAVEAIKRLNEEDLRFLNRLIVDRLKLISQARSTYTMAKFARGDQVSFPSPHGDVIEGYVLRLNKKTISIAGNDGHRWNVSPGFVRLVKPPN